MRKRVATDSVYTPIPDNPPASAFSRLNLEEKKKRTWFACALALASIAFSQGAVAAKSDSCAHCHGTDGNSTSSAYPSLAGQTREYLYRQIKAFKEGLRKNSMMSPAVAVLADQDMQDLAEYF
jgi:cytochrome c553